MASGDVFFRAEDLDVSPDEAVCDALSAVDVCANILVVANPMSIRQATANVLHEENFKIRILKASNPYNAGGATNKILDYLAQDRKSVV